MMVFNLTNAKDREEFRHRLLVVAGSDDGPYAVVNAPEVPVLGSLWLPPSQPHRFAVNKTAKQLFYRVWEVGIEYEPR